MAMKQSSDSSSPLINEVEAEDPVDSVSGGGSENKRKHRNKHKIVVELEATVPVTEPGLKDSADSTAPLIEPELENKHKKKHLKTTSDKQHEEMVKPKNDRAHRKVHDNTSDHQEFVFAAASQEKHNPVPGTSKQLLSIFCLPDALLLQVFKFLQPYDSFNAQLVSQKWCQLLRSPQLWEHAFIVGSNLAIGALSKAPYVTAPARALSIGRPWSITEAGITQLPMVFSVASLVSLDLSGCRNISESSVANLIGKMPGLQNLNLTQSRLRDSACFTLPASLRSLCICMCERLGDGVMEYVSKHCTSLETLDVSLCAKITDSGIKKLAESAVANSLRRLNISHCRWVTNTGLSVLFGACSFLTEVIASDLPISGTAINSLVKGSKTGEYELLCFSKCGNLLNDSMSYLANLKKVSILDISSTQTGDIGIQLLLQLGITINKLDLRWTHVSSESMKALTKAATFSELQFLDVSYSKVSSYGLELFFKKLEKKLEKHVIRCQVTHLCCTTQDHKERVEASLFEAQQ